MHQDLIGRKLTTRDVIIIGAAKGASHCHLENIPKLNIERINRGSWVSGENKRPVRIAAGQAAYWEKGGKHEAGSHSGMTAIVIEAQRLDPQAYMPVAQEWLEWKLNETENYEHL